ncbi:unnamed protein product [Bathycoccus prasinos]
MSNEHDEDSGVGKSNILSRFTRNEFSVESKSTIGVEFATRSIELDRSGIEQLRAHITGELWARFSFMTLQRKKLLLMLKKWLAELRDHADSKIVIMLTGNKCDLQHLRSVTTQDAEIYAAKEDLLFLETSALNSVNISTQLFKKF